MTKDAQIEFLLTFLKILQEGRYIPDKRGTGGSVRESSHSIEEIKRITIKLTELLEI
jgi:hypothetical protein